MCEGNYHGYANQNRRMNIACNSWVNLLAVSLPRFVMRQDVFLSLAVHNIDVMISQVDWLYPVTGGINYHRGAATSHAARDQRRRQAYG